MESKEDVSLWTDVNHSFNTVPVCSAFHLGTLIATEDYSPILSLFVTTALFFLPLLKVAWQRIPTLSIKFAFCSITFINYNTNGLSYALALAPLHWCLLADLCNHTWIPECGEENEEASSRRLFIDECDMYEYNCDYERDFDLVNYSDCFVAATGCPTRLPCPSRPPCPNHNFHKIGQKFSSPARRMWLTHSRTRKPKTIPDLPPHMLKGRRRYTPKPLRKKRHSRTTPTTNNIRKTAEKTIATTLQTVIVRKETIVKNGRKYVKVVRGIVKRRGGILEGFDADDFLEK